MGVAPSDHDRLRLRERLSRDADRYIDWVRLTDGPLLVLAVAFLGAVTVRFAATLTPAQTVAVDVAIVAIWAAFGADYVIRLYLAGDRRAYVRRNAIDLVIVALPCLRPIRAVRFVGILRLMAVGGEARRAASLQARVSTHVIAFAAVFTLAASYAIYAVERHARGSNIRSLPDALWWSVTTVTTVGYGDRYPTTATGRFLAVALMVVGVALVGVITAGVAAWFVSQLRSVERVEEKTEVTLDIVLAEIQRLHERLDSLERKGVSS